MHILCLVQFYPPGGSEGSGKHHDLVQKLLAEGHRVTVVAGRISYMTGRPFQDVEHSEDEGSPHNRVLRLWMPPGYNRNLVTRAIGFLVFMLQALVVSPFVSRPDIVFATSPPPTLALIGALVKRLRNSRFVFEIRDMWVEDAIALGVIRNGLLIHILRRCERWIETGADAVVPVTPGFVPVLRARGVPAERITTIPNGVNLELFHPRTDGREVVRRHGLNGKFVVLCAGALGMNNDMRTILDAAHRLRNEPDVVLLIVGDGNARAFAEDSARQRSLTNIIFAGWVPHQEVPRHLAAADAAICIALPHLLNNVAYANRGFEAMASGRPLICAIDGLMRALVEDAKAGCFARPGDGGALARAILHLRALSPEERVAMGERGRLLVENEFNRSVLVERLADVVMGRSTGAVTARPHVERATSPVFGARQ